MIKVLIERNIDENCLEDYLDIIRRARKKANMSDGFIAGELLQEKQNPYHAIIISSWENIEAWNTWSKSKDRQEVLEEMSPLLKTKEKVTILENSRVLG